MKLRLILFWFNRIAFILPWKTERIKKRKEYIYQIQGVISSLSFYFSNYTFAFSLSCFYRAQSFFSATEIKRETKREKGVLSLSLSLCSKPNAHFLLFIARKLLRLGLTTPWQKWYLPLLCCYAAPGGPCCVLLTFVRRSNLAHMYYLGITYRIHAAGYIYVHMRTLDVPAYNEKTSLWLTKLFPYFPSYTDTSRLSLLLFFFTCVHPLFSFPIACFSPDGSMARGKWISVLCRSNTRLHDANNCSGRKKIPFYIFFSFFSLWQIRRNRFVQCLIMFNLFLRTVTLMRLTHSGAQSHYYSNPTPTCLVIKASTII